jgi:hypothetical protein
MKGDQSRQLLWELMGLSDSSFNGAGLPHASESCVDNFQTEMVVCQNNETLNPCGFIFVAT